MELGSKLTSLSGVGDYLKFRLQKLGIQTIEDLIHHYPFRYEDFSNNLKISEIKEGEVVTLKGQIWSIKNVYTRVGKIITTAILNDGTNSIELVFFNQSYLTKTLPVGTNLQISGKVQRRGSKVSILMPQWEKMVQGTGFKAQGSVHTGRLVPIYPETEGISSKWFRNKIAKLLPQLLPKIADPIPYQILNGREDLKSALQDIHFPKSLETASNARERLSFDELFLISLQTQIQIKRWQKKTVTKPLDFDLVKMAEFTSTLPFKLTSAQERVLSEILTDLRKGYPMNRLLQGDVGSGKTVVAAIASFLVIQNFQKVILMAPTEILAFQHYATFKKLLEPFKIEVGIYTGSKKFNKHNSKFIIQNSFPQIIIGTHALLSDKLDLSEVGLIIIDEQQRFGVEQRGILRQKVNSPHFLTMTATPIPRTVALVLYGDLNMSVIDQLPPGRFPIKSHFVPAKKRADCYKFLANQIKEGRQIYIITPFIEESETAVSAKAAKVEFARLKKEVFPNFKLGLLHGKLKFKEKEEVLKQFKEGKINILVSTSVVEVGVDMPNATVMLVEGAERFGLAQLHQLRGRVGRGGFKSYTFFFTEVEHPQIVNRIKNLEKINDGMKLAELDLKIRGSGELYGTAQSGSLELKVADLTDLKLIEESKSAAAKILSDSPELDKYPNLLRKLQDLDQIVMPD